MFSWIQLRLIAPLALLTLALLCVLAYTREPDEPLMLAVAGAALLALGVWYQGVRSHDAAVRELKAAAEVVSRGGAAAPVGLLLRERQDELGALARTLRDASEELERRAHEREVERDELRTVIQSIQEGLIAVDRDLRVLLWSPKAAELLGLAAAPREGSALVDASAHGELVALARRAIASGATERAEAPLVGVPAAPGGGSGGSGDDADGGVGSGPAERRVELSAAPIARGASVIGAVLLLRDVTEMHAHQRARREFAANVSHELRTPLQLVKGFVETLRDGALTDPEKGPRFLDIAYRHVLGLERLVSDLLTLLTLEGRIETRPPGAVDVKGSIEMIVAGFEERLASKGLRLVTTLPDGLPPALARPDLFDRAVQNLIENAIKYTDQGGTVTVEARARPGGRIAVLVHDTGPGIPAADLPHVFRRFYRVDKSRSREQGGTGLGLAIVKHIMQLEGGEVRAESEVGKGTTFKLRFQTATDLPAEPAASPPRSASEAGP